MSTKCHEKAQVVDISKDGFLKIVINRTDACGSCVAQSSCAALGGKQKNIYFYTKNTVKAQKGDIVRVSLDTSALVINSLTVYLVPSLGLILGAILAYFISPDKSEQSIIAKGAFGGLGIGFILSFLIGKILSKNDKMLPQVTSVEKPN